jgi:hypothetical protein
VNITNLKPQPTPTDATATFKQIVITAAPQVAETQQAWLQNLGTSVTIQRVRAN